MELTSVEKIKILADRKGMSIVQLAAALNTTRQNLSNKISRGDFRESELRAIAQVLGCSLKIDFVISETNEEL